MAQLNYEIPDELHRALKSEAAIQGITLKQLILNMLVLGMAKTERVNWSMPDHILSPSGLDDE